MRKKLKLILALVAILAFVSFVLLAKRERDMPFKISRGEVRAVRHWYFTNTPTGDMQQSEWIVQGTSLDSLIADVRRSCPETEGWQWNAFSGGRWSGLNKAGEKLWVSPNAYGGLSVVRSREGTPARYALAWIEMRGSLQTFDMRAKGATPRVLGP